MRPITRTLSNNGQPIVELQDEVVWTEGLDMKDDSSKVEQEENNDDLLYVLRKER